MQSISLPQKPKFTQLGDMSGKVEIEGCYPGYGTTLGNALRRVLLSSLSGAAITSVKIKGINHEFSTIPNVLEDLIQIILNLKQVRFRLFKDEPVKATLKIKGEKKITAGMFECPSDIEVVSKDVHIATITSPKGELEMEIEVNPGIGYIPVEQREKEEKEVGTISIDAVYTPIRRVNYAIENMRVGKKTDFERVTLEIDTDGTITPEEAFLKAVNILVEQFSILGSFKEKEEASVEEVSEKAEKKEDSIEKADPKKVEISELKGISTRTLNATEKNKLATVGDIIKLTEKELAEMEGMGAKGIKELKKAIGEFGFNLKQEK
ncbi:MAG: DNA-directed RNA polymerase subunit alpha [Candidatus Moranbacteria bacterium]|nr:DNA-directed RNA polymerase subunit alpha [Candidatus Moranbacteria bacterium]